jgi:hypothetical protein
MNPIILGVFAVALFVVAGCQENEPAPANPSSQPGRVLGLEEGWELAPKANYSAEQRGGQVTITANGESATAGYQVKLVQSPLRIWPPQWLLAHKKPDGAVAQVITPYEVSASFKAQEPVEWLKVTDARGSMHVPVTRD